MNQRKVLVVGLDGLRHDRIFQVATPNLRRLIRTGAYGTGLLPYFPPVSRTDSGPGWSSIATGVWPPKHGVVDNHFKGADYATYPDFLTRAARAGKGTYAILSWAELSKHGTFGEEIGEKVVHDGEAIRFEAADILITEAVERYLKLNDPDAMFVYLGSIDEAGHEHGAMSAQYVRALEDVDGHLGRILVALSRRPSYAEENWLVIVTTDHGHVDQGGHGGDSDVERGIFVILNGPEVAAGRELSDPALVDIAPTVLDHLGLPQDTCFEGASLQVSAGQSGTEPMAV